LRDSRGTQVDGLVPEGGSHDEQMIWGGEKRMGEWGRKRGSRGSFLAGRRDWVGASEWWVGQRERLEAVGE
jgi:hypothetical protein